MLLFDLLIFIFILILLLFLSMLWPPDSPWAPFWTTPPSIARRMCVMAKINEKTIVYDLGCGTGTAIGIAAKEFGSPCVGIEIDPLRFLIAKWHIHRLRVDDRVALTCNNFFNINLSDADVFFMYLIPNALKRLTPKMLKEVKKGALFVSYVYEMPVELFNSRLRLLEHDKKNRLYLYKMIE